MLRNQLRPALVMTLLLMVITGIVYPGAVTVVAHELFPRQASGSLVLAAGGRVVGSAPDRPGVHSAVVFPSRPSAAGSGYVGDSSNATNKGPTDRKLADTLIAQAVDSVVAADGAVRGQVPSDMVTSSASGLDPDISAANAGLQVARVARARARRPGPDTDTRGCAHRRPPVRNLRRAPDQRVAPQSGPGLSVLLPVPVFYSLSSSRCTVSPAVRGHGV